MKSKSSLFRTTRCLRTALLLLTRATVIARAQEKKPNILVIFGDDIGIPQISAYTIG